MRFLAALLSLDACLAINPLFDCGGDQIVLVLSTIWTLGDVLRRNKGAAAAKPKAGAQSLRRALSVLRVVAAGREAGLPLSEVVQATGLTRPTAHRLVNVLVEEGIVEKRARSKRYAIGHQVPELALARP